MDNYEVISFLLKQYSHWSNLIIWAVLRYMAER